MISFPIGMVSPSTSIAMTAFSGQKNHSAGNGTSALEKMASLGSGRTSTGIQAALTSSASGVVSPGWLTLSPLSPPIAATSQKTRTERTSLAG